MKEWKWRLSRRCIERIYYAHPVSDERFYLKILLNIIKGPTCYEDIHIVNGATYPNFKDACHALSLLDSDKKLNECLIEASY